MVDFSEFSGIKLWTGFDKTEFFYLIWNLLSLDVLFFIEADSRISAVFLPLSSKRGKIYYLPSPFSKRKETETEALPI